MGEEREVADPELGVRVHDVGHVLVIERVRWNGQRCVGPESGWRLAPKTSLGIKQFDEDAGAS